MLGRLSPKYDQPLQSFPVNSWVDELSNAKDLDLECLEWVEDGINDSQNPLFSSSGRSDLLELQLKNKISVDSVCCHSFITGGLVSSKQPTRKKWIERLIFVLDCAKKINAKCVVLPLIEGSSIQDSFQKSIFLDSMRQVCMANNQVQILLETDLTAHKSLELLHALKQFDVGLVYDLGNATQLQYEVYEDIKILHKAIFEIHFKDKDSNGSLRLGSGMTNFSDAIKALNDFNWKGRVILETPIFENWHQEAQHNINFVKNLINPLSLK